MKAERPRVILDCNTLFQAFLSPDGPAAVCIELAEQGQITLVISSDVLAEARGVLNRPFVREREPTATPERIDAFLEQIRYSSVYLHDVPRGPTFDRDPKDQPYTDLAVAGAADYLVTRDNDLLSLMTSHSIAAKEFRQRHQNRLRIVTPVDFLGVVRQDPPARP